jgi:hypothetical protein
MIPTDPDHHRDRSRSIPTDPEHSSEYDPDRSRMIPTPTVMLDDFGHDPDCSRSCSSLIGIVISITFQNDFD